MRRLSVFFIILILLSMTGVAAQEEVSSSTQSGDFRVTEVFPVSDSRDIAGDAVITVIFNRPVVPLVAVADMSDLPQPI